MPSPRLDIDMIIQTYHHLTSIQMDNVLCQNLFIQTYRLPKIQIYRKTKIMLWIIDTKQTNSGKIDEDEELEMRNCPQIVKQKSTQVQTSISHNHSKYTWYKL